MEPQKTEPALKRVDYDLAQHAAYAKARALTHDAITRYMDAFAEHLPPQRPLTVVDLGSGTGRFSPGLADAFGGPVLGVEPSAAMRAEAQANSPHPKVRYLAGEAAAIPLPDALADMVLMFLSFHHVTDRAAAAAEIARVLNPGGVFFLRSTFKERVPNHWWRMYFPRSQAVEEAMFPTVAEARALFEAAGFAAVASVELEIPFEGDLAAAVERLKLRAVSVFEHMTDQELDDGFAWLEADLAAGTLEEKSTTGDFIVFRKASA